ncbi:MAG: PEP-utilizing enzyme, partial [Actinomycetota bacterium]
LERRYFRDPETGPGPGPAETPRSLRRRRAARRSVAAQIRASLSRRQALDDAAVVIAAGRTLAEHAVAVDDQSDDALLAYRSRLVDLGARTMMTELAVAAVAVVAFDRLERWLVAYLGDDAGPAAARRLTVGAGRRRPPHPSASRAVFAGPTWAESGRDMESPRGAGDRPDPEDEWRAVEVLLAQSIRWRHTRHLGAGVVDLRLHMLRRLVDDATHCLTTREATKGALLTVGGELRRVHLALGSRLAARGLVGASEDVEFLDSGELRRALHDGLLPPALVVQRRRAHARSTAMPPLPERFRTDGRSRAAPPTPARSDAGSILEGWAASAGVHTGTAVVLVDAETPDALPPGSVLVAVQTDASWLPVFLRAGAIVVERGGPLSHAAIVARELGLPAVLNVPGAAGMLGGSTVTVDGDRGVIVVHDVAPTGAP